MGENENAIQLQDMPTLANLSQNVGFFLQFYVIVVKSVLTFRGSR